MNRYVAFLILLAMKFILIFFFTNDSCQIFFYRPINKRMYLSNRVAVCVRRDVRACLRVFSGVSANIS